jgi:hypothetical protein
MANYKEPWNKGTADSKEVKKLKRRNYYFANKEKIIAKVLNRYNQKKDEIVVGRKWQRIKRKYGLTKEAYETMEKQQGYKCAVCKKRKIEVVDHCHANGHVRGLLCKGCNRDISILDNPELLESAKRYKYGAN